MRPILASSLAAFLLAGCSLAPTYRRPAAPVPAAYPEPASQEDIGTPAADLAWRRFFGDARLRRLIRLALDNNRDFRVAALNVERVRALYDIQRTALIPSLDATADGTRSRTPADLGSSGRPVTGSTYRVGGSVPSYEIDFFGRVRSLRDQVLQQYLATDEARLSAQLGLVSAVARQYLALLAADEQLALARRISDAAERSYELNQKTFEAGVSSELDLSSSEAQRETYRANVASFEQQRARAENALVLLVGAPLPSDLPPAGSLAAQGLIEDLPAGLPSELLSRRPDIRAAEHTLRAANANIGVARAAFFPSVTLTAFAGTASAELSGLFKDGSGAWSFSPSVTVPIFAAGRNKAQLKVARVEQRIGIANYEKAVQSAFRDVADALAVRASVNAQIAAQEARVAAAQRRHDLTDQRYQGGIDSFLALLLARQELFGAQQSLLDARLLRLTNLVSLYAALGGGWKDDASGPSRAVRPPATP
ncbi:MAG: efflux transporter outer membrane subunit [Opitutaceae bacterium]|jgi:multidrug efflux system outer membrane protein